MKKNLFIIEIVAAIVLAFAIGIGLGFFILGGGSMSSKEPTVKVPKPKDAFVLAEQYLTKDFQNIREYFGSPDNVVMKGEQAYITFKKNGMTYLFDKTLIKDGNFAKLEYARTVDNNQLNLDAQPVLDTFGLSLKTLLKTEKDYITSKEINTIMPTFKYYLETDPATKEELASLNIKVFKPDEKVLGTVYVGQMQGYDISMFIPSLEWDVARIDTNKIVYFNKIKVEEEY